MITRWLFGKDKEATGTLVGLDAAGKTTMMYQMKLEKGWNITLMDLGGCDRIRPLIRHFMGKDRFVLFVLDCHDHDRLEEGLEELRFATDLMIEAGGKHIWVMINKQDLLPEGQRDEIVQNQRERCIKVLEPFKDKCFTEVFDLPGLSSKSGYQLDKVLARVRQVMLNEKPKPKASLNSPPPPAEGKEVKPAIPAPPTRDELIERVKKAASDVSSHDVFWKEFLSAEIPAWDHYTHLRAGYFVMLEGLSVGSSIMDCAEDFIEHLGRLRAAHPDRFRNTTHRTMTVFWLIQLQTAAVKYQSDNGLEGYPTTDKFTDVLLHSPELMNSGLWREYYSKELLFTPDAKENWRLPDVKPLVSIAGIRKEAKAYVTTEGYNLDLALRMALVVVQKTVESKARRGAIVKRALADFQSLITRLRAQDASVQPYSETQAYFWIQITHAAIASLQTAKDKQPSPQVEKIIWNGSVSDLTLDTFKTLFGITGKEWAEYYSQSRWESIPARMQFTTPDLKNLPNVISIPSQSNVSHAKNHTLEKSSAEDGGEPHRPSEAELTAMVSVMVEEVASLPEPTSGSLVSTHAELLQRLYQIIICSDKELTDGDSSSPKRGTQTRQTAAAIEKATELRGPVLDGVTQRVFWIQQFRSAKETVPSVIPFADFLKVNPTLANERLPYAFYSPELWRSAEAKETLKLPDRQDTMSQQGATT